jgi:hypothetical protein
MLQATVLTRSTSLFKAVCTFPPATAESVPFRSVVAALNDASTVTGIQDSTLPVADTYFLWYMGVLHGIRYFCKLTDSKSGMGCNQICVELSICAACVQLGYRTSQKCNM